MHDPTQPIAAPSVVGPDGHEWHVGDTAIVITPPFDGDNASEHYFDLDTRVRVIKVDPDDYADPAFQLECVELDARGVDTDFKQWVRTSDVRAHVLRPAAGAEQ